MGLWRKLFVGAKTGGNRGRPVRLMLEAFESRDLPNASPFFAGIHQLLPGNPGQFGAATPGFEGPFGFGERFGLGGLFGQGLGQGQTQVLAASLTGATGTSGTALFFSNSTTGDNSLSVRVSGLAANSTFTVTSGTTTLGTLNTDANGRGFLTVSNVSPALASGAAINILDSSSATVLSGTLGSPSALIGTHLSASLTGATGTSGTAHFDSSPISGESSLRLRVSRLAADSTYTVQVNSTTVGQLSTDANGRGRLSESVLSTAAASGSTITVLDPSGTTVLQGTFAADTGGDHGFGPLFLPPWRYL
jgi:hypothetical protein